MSYFPRPYFFARMQSKAQRCCR